MRLYHIGRLRCYLGVKSCKNFKEAGTVVKSAVRIDAALLAGHCAGVEQYTGVDKCLVDFALRFMDRPAERRRGFLALAEKEFGGFPDEIRFAAIGFIRDLCDAADKREGEWRGA
ncbi:hypothetical protein PTH_0166 [Pelotomaculum thermopropionicum SI]|uniref:Uncharacterized protein n=1 Tax=Pelotomaculum thermopropionicum (strain DSM 13744 / JCM 10971 / SI) TaxID=370438 RepID=A5D5Y2_PELTS|nr:hypothetical protein PTH_0166 [Pelotomaculum thermopropionicum SI]